MESRACARNRVYIRLTLNQRINMIQVGCDIAHHKTIRNHLWVGDAAPYTVDFIRYGMQGIFLRILYKTVGSLDQLLKAGGLICHLEVFPSLYIVLGGVNRPAR